MGMDRSTSPKPPRRRPGGGKSRQNRDPNKANNNTENNNNNTRQERIAINLDETLGVPLINNERITGFQVRDGAIELLNSLRKRYALVLWSAGDRSYVNKLLSYGLRRYFREVYAWDDIPDPWKDIRRIKVRYLIDDSDHHQQLAAREGLGLEAHYIVVPAFGSPEDLRDPLSWTRQIREMLLQQQQQSPSG